MQEMNYQTFCSKAFSDGIQLVGLRTAESLTRFKCIANTKMERITRGGKFYPIYDWKDSDVWLYIKERNLEFPEIYMRLYEAGVERMPSGCAHSSVTAAHTGPPLDS